MILENIIFTLAVGDANVAVQTREQERREREGETTNLRYSFELIAPPQISHDRVMVPVEYLYRVLGLEVRYVPRCSDGYEVVRILIETD
jgi:hypothetical protein